MYVCAGGCNSSTSWLYIYFCLCVPFTTQRVSPIPWKMWQKSYYNFPSSLVTPDINSILSQWALLIEQATMFSSVKGGQGMSWVLGKDYMTYFILLLFNYSCLRFPPTITPHPSQTHLPLLLPPSPFVLSMCPLKFFLKMLPPIIRSLLPSGYCQIVLNFNVSS